MTQFIMNEEGREEKIRQNILEYQEKDGQQVESQILAKSGYPFLTWGLIGINAVIYGLLTLAGGSTKIPVLVKFGAQMNLLVVQGEYWRLFTSMFLHIGVAHLVFNCLALFLFGRIPESLYGRIRYITIYIVSGYIGNILYLAFGSPNIVSAGASGAIFGVIGANVALNRHIRASELFRDKRKGIVGAGYVIYMFIRSTGAGVNILAHLGGVLCGVGLGFLLCPSVLKTRLALQNVDESIEVQADTVSKRMRIKALAIGFVVILLTVVCFQTPQVRNSRQEAKRSGAVTHYNLGVIYQGQDKLDEAIKEYKIAISINSNYANAYLNLGLVYTMQGKLDEARAELNKVIELDLESEATQTASDILKKLKKLPTVPQTMRSEKEFQQSIQALAQKTEWKFDPDEIEMFTIAMQQKNDVKEYALHFSNLWMTANEIDREWQFSYKGKLLSIEESNFFAYAKTQEITKAIRTESFNVFSSNRICIFSLNRSVKDGKKLQYLVTAQGDGVKVEMIDHENKRTSKSFQNLAAPYGYDPDSTQLQAMKIGDKWAYTTFDEDLLDMVKDEAVVVQKKESSTTDEPWTMQCNITMSDGTQIKTFYIKDQIVRMSVEGLEFVICDVKEALAERQRVIQNY